jgi:hypothetical protein
MFVWVHVSSIILLSHKTKWLFIAVVDPAKAFQQLLQTLGATPTDRNPSKKRQRKPAEKLSGGAANGASTAASAKPSRRAGEAGEGGEGATANRAAATVGLRRGAGEGGEGEESGGKGAKRAKTMSRVESTVVGSWAQKAFSFPLRLRGCISCFVSQSADELWLTARTRNSNDSNDIPIIL